MATAKVRSKQPLIVIVGPTASGKTRLGVQLATAYNGEVISADSRAIYRGLSIGTAKPSLSEQAGIPHWGIDLADPGERFTAADFQQYAKEKVTDIRSRGKLPIIVGGTGLYIDAVVYDFEFPSQSNDLVRREELQSWSTDQLHEYCVKNNIKLPINDKNPRHLVNAILRNGQKPKSKHKLDGDTLVVGIATEKNILRNRIQTRAGQIFTNLVVSEATVAAQKHGWLNEAMTGNIYPLIRSYLAGEMTLEEAKEQFVHKDWQLAKRQLTWFRRNPDIQWFPLEDAYTFIARWLDNLNKS